MRSYLLLLVLATAFLLPGCNRTRPSPGASPAKKPVPASVTESAGDIRDFGYIRKLSRKEGRWTLTIAYADLLHGEEARKAAVKDKAIGPDDDLEDDYYIHETDESGTFPVDERVIIRIIAAGEKADQSVPLMQFADVLGGKVPEKAHLSDAPFWFTMNGDRVTKIEQQFIP